MPEYTVEIDVRDLLDMLEDHDDEVVQWLKDGGCYSCIAETAFDVINNPRNDDIVTDRAKELGMVWREDQ